VTPSAPPRRAVVAAAALALGLVLVARPAAAEVERYAVIIGHNSGAADEQRLRFAETDAARVGDLLGEVGGVPAENQVVLRGRGADEVRRGLIATNERIRVARDAGRDAVLFVYYSGHGDADALHLGDSRLALRELEALVRGSAAAIRILVVDSCRSGAVTRVKGGRPAPALRIGSGDELPGEGLIVLTASTAGEDAQESEALAGSFFTHYLLSALRGAADEDGDRRVTVAEAFSYTRAQTILASSRTLSGTQHPTFHYDLRGRADVIVADLGGRGRGTLTLPADATWLVIGDGASVVGEIVAGAEQRRLSLRPGRYRLRGRTRDALLEGEVTVRADADSAVAIDALERTTYARLVRKGGGEVLTATAGPLAALVAQSAVVRGASPCLGAAVGWQFARADLTASPRLIACRGDFRNQTLTATTDALGLELRLAKAWDVPVVTVDLAVGLGAELLQERFVTRGVAPTRTSLAGHLDVGGGMSTALGERWTAGLELAAQTHFFSVEAQAGDRHLTARFSVRALVAIGAWL
jgi:hypothetical protein